LFQTFLKNIKLNSNGFKVKLSLNQKFWEQRWVVVKDSIAFFYWEQNDFLKDGNSFWEAIFLIRTDHISFEKLSDDLSLVKIKNNNDIFPILIEIKTKYHTQFLF